jgi:septal ring-binding cell division protein DamX
VEAAVSPSVTPEASLPTSPPVTTLAATPSAPPPPAPAGILDPREAFRRGDYTTAARGFEAKLRAEARGAHTVQILVACSDETLQKAQQNAPQPELFIVPVAYQGRSCYRLCWGVFDSESRARAATGDVPAYFRENGAKPKPVTSASILP